MSCCCVLFAAQTVVTFENMGEIAISIFSPYVAILLVAVLLTTFLLFIGFVTDAGKFTHLPGLNAVR